MWPFNRRKKSLEANQEMPPEVKRFYESEHRERTGLAWVIAFVSLVVTIAVIIGLFFGGRWAYRKIAHTGNKTTATKQTTKTTTKTTQPAATNQPAKSSSQAANGQSQANGSQPTPSTSTPNNATKPTTPTPTATTPSPTPSTTTPTSTPNKLSNTGPGNTLAIFAIVSLVGALAHSSFLRFKQAKNFKI